MKRNDISCYNCKTKSPLVHSFAFLGRRYQRSVSPFGEYRRAIIRTLIFGRANRELLIWSKSGSIREPPITTNSSFGVKVGQSEKVQHLWQCSWMEPKGLARISRQLPSLATTCFHSDQPVANDNNATVIKMADDNHFLIV